MASAGEKDWNIAAAVHPVWGSDNILEERLDTTVSLLFLGIVSWP